MIEFRGTQKDIFDQIKGLHGTAKNDKFVCLFGYEEEYDENWNAEISKLWKKITDKTFK